ncbi:MAG: hypothetical protein PHE25_03590 [Candidatus Gracilibacteria bacterium]|nr:hypothetical protein [Candidatus Gracilibacteria bacterium]
MKKVVILFIILFITLVKSFTFANNENYKTEEFGAFKMSKFDNGNFIFSTTKNGKEIIIINGKQEFEKYNKVYDYDISDNGKYSGFVGVKNGKLVIGIIENGIIEENKFIKSENGCDLEGENIVFSHKYKSPGKYKIIFKDNKYDPFKSTDDEYGYYKKEIFIK